MFILRSRRGEYAKRFEETTKQEIKNYNDSLLNTHMALEDFRRKLKDSVDQYAKQVAILSSNIKKIEIENTNLKNELAELNRKLKSQIHDFNKLEREKIDGDKNTKDFKNWVKKEFQFKEEEFISLHTTMMDSKLMLQRRVEDIFLEVGHSYRKSKVDNETLKKEILSLPSEAQEVKKELLQKIDVSSIDNAGITKEFEKVKKKAFIQEKMNEYFKTQIDRLKDTQVFKE